MVREKKRHLREWREHLKKKRRDREWLEHYKRKKKEMLVDDENCIKDNLKKTSQGMARQHKRFFFKKHDLLGYSKDVTKSSEKKTYLRKW